MDHALSRLTLIVLIAALPLVVGAAGSTAAERHAPEWYLEQGINAYAAGDYKKAIDVLDTALSRHRSGDHVSRVLLYRGLAYRKSGEPARAVADLTKALQAPADLSDEEREAAERNRMTASREAGIGDMEKVVVTALPPIRQEKARAETTRPAAHVAAPASFVTTASIAPSPSIPPSPPLGSTWATVTKVATTIEPPARPMPTAAATRTPALTPAPVQPAAAPTDIRLQIAVARSPSEAAALSVRLTSQYGEAFGRRKLQISEARDETGGTFYRLRLGPYANADEFRELCGQLRAAEYECLRE